VLLESEWVLRSGYGFEPRQIAEGLRGFAGLPGITTEQPLLLTQALDWMVDGMEFADALHLGAAKDCDVFLSFDRKFAKPAVKRSSIKVQSP
jgi:predicted nucleic-acid-binding protein